MTIKDVIAQAEDRFEEKFPDMNISQRTAPPVYLPNAPRKMLKEFIFSTYTKDLLQSVEEMVESKKIVGEFDPWSDERWWDL